ncbi:molybdate ABC transporter substrate-binding protein [Lentibacillus halophilus]|uniref:Molybdate ABC transporter substrate-binding protein n=1 Tax=Lentibacillus halophilus TaxID=295065 RepID=A0ABP3J190_9BACI
MRYLGVILIFAAAVISVGCTGQDNADTSEVVVSASSSLSDVLGDLADAFQEEHPDAALSFHYGASSKLADQISNGSPVDVFLSAGQQPIEQLTGQNLLTTDTEMDFARNRLILASSKQESFPATSIKQLPELNIKQIAMGNPENIAAGKYATQALKKSGVWETIKETIVYTNEGGRSLTYVESGNMEAGFIYSSDLQRSELIQNVFTIDDDLHAPIIYTGAVITSSKDKQTAKAFVSFLQTDKARSILKNHGFSGV